MEIEPTEFKKLLENAKTKLIEMPPYGKALVANRDFKIGELVGIYEGTLMSQEEARSREKKTHMKYLHGDSGLLIDGIDSKEGLAFAQHAPVGQGGFYRREFIGILINEFKGKCIDINPNEIPLFGEYSSEAKKLLEQVPKEHLIETEEIKLKEGMEKKVLLENVICVTISSGDKTYLAGFASSNIMKGELLALSYGLSWWTSRRELPTYFYKETLRPVESQFYEFLCTKAKEIHCKFLSTTPKDINLKFPTAPVTKLKESKEKNKFRWISDNPHGTGYNQLAGKRVLLLAKCKSGNMLVKTDEGEVYQVKKDDLKKDKGSMNHGFLLNKK